jgi:hypothetical protein
MVFSDTSTNLGLIQSITFLSGADLNSYLVADRTRNINDWYGKVVSWIFEADGRWQWDDSNQTNSPTATADLVSGQKDYLLLTASPTASQDWLRPLRVEILDENDNKIALTSLDLHDIPFAYDDYYSTNGTPEKFDVRDNSLYLFPAPDYNKTNGLIVYFQRAPLLFAASDTTKKPGFASIFHKVLSLGASYDWLFSKGDSVKANQIKNEIEILNADGKVIGGIRKDIINFYSKRNKYEKPVIRRAYSNYK